MPPPPPLQLDILACHAQGSGIVGGSIQVNNKPLRVSKFRRVSCYVLQASAIEANSFTAATKVLPHHADGRERGDAAMFSAPIVAIPDRLPVINCCCACYAAA